MSYQDLVKLSSKAALFESISMLLEWDQETLMPKKGIELRSKQIELIASLHHKERTSKDFAKKLDALIDLETGEYKDSSLTDSQRAAVREYRRDYLLQAKLPTDFVEEWAKVTSAATHAWAEAKEQDAFDHFKPHLEKILSLIKRKADFLGFEDHPYDALINYYEPEMRTTVLTTLFERLKIPLTTLLKETQAKKQPEDPFFHKEYPHEKQLALGKKILAAMGFDKSFSRLDESAHPMCIPIHPYDMRMTTRVYPNKVMVNLLSCIHEGGHGLYHIHLPEEHFGTPLCQAASLAIDESQSRTWETLIGRSLPFWEHYFPILKQTFPQNFGDVHLESFYKALNNVSPTLIRTDSDEVTYNLHIMVRFELEKSLVEGNVKADEVPDAWNEKMREYLGITPPAPSLGCLQDIHWSLGAIGYFPTYTLGNLYGAQFFEAFAEKHPNWKERVAKGELTFISDWQKDNIHRFGRQYLPEELCERVTGKPLSEKPFVNYLQKKYGHLYHLTPLQ